MKHSIVFKYQSPHTGNHYHQWSTVKQLNTRLPVFSNLYPALRHNLRSVKKSVFQLDFQNCFNKQAQLVISNGLFTKKPYK